MAFGPDTVDRYFWHHTAMRESAKAYAAKGLSVRAVNCLLNDGLATLQDVAKRTRHELLRIPNFGYLSLAQVEAALASEGLRLADVTEITDPRLARLMMEKEDAHRKLAIAQRDLRDATERVRQRKGELAAQRHLT